MKQEVGVIFDWISIGHWNTQVEPSISLKYVDQIHRYYRYFYDHNMGVTMIPVEQIFLNIR